MLRNINLQLFAEKDDEEIEEIEEIEEPKKKKPAPQKNSIDEKLDKLISLLTPKEQEKTETLKVPVPKKPKLNPPEEEELEEQKGGESFWEKIGKILWR